MVETPKQVTLYFEPERHIYYDDEGNYYTSATQLLGKYKKPFRADFFAEIDAKKSGKTVEEIKANWEVIKNVACEKGTRIHNRIENLINDMTGYKKTNTGVRTYSQKFQTLNELQQYRLAIEYPDIYYSLSDYINHGFIIYTEKRVYNYQYKLSGTMDLFIINLNTNEFVIQDHKTNKDEPKFVAGYYKKEWVNGVKIPTNKWVFTNDTFLYPLEHIPCSKGFEYAMQLCHQPF